MARRKSKDASIASVSPETSDSIENWDVLGLSDAMRKQLHSPPSPYEVRCDNCETSFAPGRKKCVHCGLRLSRPSPIADIPVETVEGVEVADQDARVRVGPGRNLMWIITAIAMLIGSSMRACQ